MVDCLALICSVIAVIVSIVTYFLGQKENNRLNQLTLEAEYFSDIYKKYLIKDIPNARRFIQFVDTRLTGTGDMIKLLDELLQDSYYYMYKDPTFFEKVKIHSQKLSDYLALCSGRNYVGEEQTEVLTEIKSLLAELYSCITNHLIGLN